MERNVVSSRKPVRKRPVPFDMSPDPFYSEANISYLKKVIAEIDSGVARLEEHELIEV